MREAEKTKKRPRLPRCDVRFLPIIIHNNSLFQPIPLKTMRPVSPLPIFTFEEEQFTTSPIQQVKISFSLKKATVFESERVFLEGLQAAQSLPSKAPGNYSPYL